MRLEYGVKDIPAQKVSAGELFEHLSKKDGHIWGYGFEKQIKIELSKAFKNSTNNRSKIAFNSGSYTISEVSMPWRIHPFRLFMKPQSAESKKETVSHFLDLVDCEKKNIVKNPNNDIERILNAFDRIIGNMTRNMSETDAKELLKNRDAIRKTLESANTEYHKEYFAKGQGLKKNDSTSPAHFFKALSSQWTLGLRKSGFKQRFQVVERRDGRFEVHLFNKPWFFQKWARFPSEITSWKFWKDFAPTPVPSAAKVATVENLLAMIKHEFSFIRYLQPNIGGMTANLNQIKKNIVRNTTASDKEKIEKAIDGAIKELKKLEYLTRKDFNNSWRGFIWQWIKYFSGATNK